VRGVAEAHHEGGRSQTGSQKTPSGGYADVESSLSDRWVRSPPPVHRHRFVDAGGRAHRPGGERIRPAPQRRLHGTRARLAEGDRPARIRPLRPGRAHRPDRRDAAPRRRHVPQLGECPRRSRPPRGIDRRAPPRARNDRPGRRPPQRSRSRATPRGGLRERAGCDHPRPVPGDREPLRRRPHRTRGPRQRVSSGISTADRGGPSSRGRRTPAR